jgi:LCP family protein required for cell wall assembly
VSTPPLASGEVVPDAPGPPHRSRWVKALKWISITLASILVLGVAGAVADYYYIKSKIKVVPYTTPNGTVRPAKVATKAANFVLIGSDTRAGASGKGTGGSKIAGARSDTTIVLHISANGTGATMVSIPRDSYVQIPSCVIGPHNELSSPQLNKFNAAYSIGAEYNNKYAASCTVHTIETLTHIHIDHYAVVDFAGFEHIVEALGGVKMCVASQLYDPIVDDNGAYHGSGLNLPAGKSVEINGSQALALMRARYNLDGGGDLPRIKRQQEFIAAMIRKATSSSLLVNPFKLQHVLVSAAGSLTTDGFGLGTMHKLANALHSAGAGSVRLLTVPNLTDQPGLPYGDVMWDPSKAPALWAAIRDDKPIPGTAPKPSPSASPSATGSPTPSGPKLIVAPSGISIAVENGTTRSGLAQTVASELEAQGFHVASVGDADNENYVSTVVKYGPGKVQSSQTTKAAIPGSVRQADPTAGTTITVIVGSNFAKVVPVTLSASTTTPTPTPTPTISSITAAKPGCLS